jgi:hypothetical protein
MSDYDIHSCGYYCDRPACIERQRNELRDKLFEEISTSERNIQTSDKETPESSQPWVKTYSGGKPNYTEPTIDGWPLWSGLPPPKKEWVGLTEDYAIDLLPNVGYEYEVDVEVILSFAKAIEAKLKEKNCG